LTKGLNVVKRRFYLATSSAKKGSSFSLSAFAGFVDAGTGFATQTSYLLSWLLRRRLPNDPRLFASIRLKLTLWVVEVGGRDILVVEIVRLTSVWWVFWESGMAMRIATDATELLLFFESWEDWCYCSKKLIMLARTCPEPRFSNMLVETEWAR